MTGPVPVLLARWVIAATVLVLPAGSRDRYREELRTEIAELVVAAQLWQSLSLLLGSVNLRRALTARDLPAVAVPKKPWRCRVGRHRYVVQQGDNPELKGRGYLRCLRCGKSKDPPSYGPAVATALGAG